jgi:hypothetical protein
MKSIGLIVFGFIFLVSCRSTAPSVSTQRTDSVAVTETNSFQDTSVYSPADSVSITTEIWTPSSTGEDMPAFTLSSPTVTSKSKSATVKASIKDGILKVDCNCDSTELKLKIAQKIISTYHSQSENRSEVKVEQVKFIPWYINILAWIGGCTTAGVLIYFLSFIRKLN